MRLRIMHVMGSILITIIYKNIVGHVESRGLLNREIIIQGFGNGT